MYFTRAGTRVHDNKAAHLAIIEEVYRDAHEFFVYKNIISGEKMFAENGDRLLVHGIDDSHAYALNLLDGSTTIIAWEDICHCVKPIELCVTR